MILWSVGQRSKSKVKPTLHMFGEVGISEKCKLMLKLPVKIDSYESNTISALIPFLTEIWLLYKSEKTKCVVFENSKSTVTFDQYFT